MKLINKMINFVEKYFMFIQADLNVILTILDKLKADQQALWGKMSAQEMVEHLTDTLRIAQKKITVEMAIPEEKLPSMLRFLESDKEMMKNISVAFAPEKRILRNEELELAIDEFTEEWIDFETFFNEDNVTSLHPYYGNLNFSQWKKLNSKHLTHHFKQFGLLA